MHKVLKPAFNVDRESTEVSEAIKETFWKFSSKAPLEQTHFDNSIHFHSGAEKHLA